jgi:phosphate transport system ATP-binding protein
MRKEIDRMHESTAVAASGFALLADAAEPSATLPAHTIEADGLSCWYGGVQALDGVDLTIPRGEITALVGPSGCGKSTFLRCVNRLNDLVRGFRQSGSLRLDGVCVQDPTIDLTALRRRVGMVFQHPNPFPMSIRDNVLLAVKEHRGRIPQREAEEVVEQALTRANLFDEVKDRLDSSALALSGGQQQRLCIARALAVMPEVLMLDEPCASLDPISTARIEELLLELKSDYTIVIVTHNLAQAARISEHMAFFYLGKVLEYGRTSDVMASPSHHRTAEYLCGTFG